MNNQKNDLSADEREESLVEKERRMLPFFIEFVKFSAGFAAIVAIALIALNAASAAMG